MKPRRVIAALLFSLLPLVASAGSWWNGDWAYRKVVSFDLSPTGAAISGSVEHVPVLVRLSLGNFAYFNNTNPDGSDFRVIDADDHTPLKFHFERFDAKNQLAYLWIALPKLTGGSKADKVYLYYGNSNAKSAADVAGTFDVDQVLDLEFSQASGPPRDATAYKNDASVSTAQPIAASLIAGGEKFAGAQSITVPSSPSLRLVPSQGLTVSAWVKLDGPQNDADLISLQDGSRELGIGIAGTHPVARYTDGSTPVTVQATSAALPAGEWHLLALTVGAGQLALYVDGVAVGQAPVQLQPIGGVLTIGASAQKDHFLSGEVDQVEVSKIARSADWLKALAQSEGPKAPMLVYGSDEQKESGGQTSYFVTIAKNLTVDGWVVIVICLTMLVFALGLMGFKTYVLGRVERANRLFLADYHHLAAGADTTSLDRQESAEEEERAESAPAMAALIAHDGKYGASTLYRIYHMGVAELRKRVDPRPGGGRGTTSLSAQSIEAIRASMDATMTRLQQQLSAQMVMLTIAISGGPFLGLLGTVIGVMITFAAIAASGDVNVNAIAPGTAAALAATVAGLSVAIPCLFGYNWLNTRIKAIAVNNRVFLDEFIARIAEQYS
ncbi:MAG: DUF2341 domain-containing protein [Gammaproteobacteria bacterium]|nr:DUF2341 domain-containing protein [Gammaproteobacteria bacterium]